MSLYALFKHYTPDEMKDGLGTMASCAMVEAESDESAVTFFVMEHHISPLEMSVNWRQENKKYSVVKLCPPTE